MDDMAEFRNRVRRGPWTGGDLNDVFAARSAIATEPSGIAQDIGFTPAQASRVQTGVSNHNFRDAPPDTSLNIADITNKLPEWSFVQSSGTAITAKWVADSGSGSGGILRFDVASGAAGDFSYIEQVISVPSTRAQTWNVWGIAKFRNRSASKSFVIWGEAQALKDDGTATGTPTVFSTAWSSATYTDEQITIPQTSGVLPSDAQDIRFRIGIKRDAALTSDTGTIDLTECRLNMAQSFGVFADQTPGATYAKPAVITQRDGALYIHSNFDPTKATTPGASAGSYPYITFQQPNISPPRPALITDYRTIDGVLGNHGWAIRAYPQGLGPSSVSTSSTTLTNQYDAMIVPVVVPSAMRVVSITVRQGVSDGTQRNFSVGLACQSAYNAGTMVMLSQAGTGNYTAGAVSNETLNIGGATGYVIIEPGVYWVVIQNQHATRTHVTRVLGGGDWAPNTAATSTTIGDLTGLAANGTFDGTAFGGRITGIPMVRLNGDVLGTGAFG